MDYFHECISSLSTIQSTKSKKLVVSNTRNLGRIKTEYIRLEHLYDLLNDKREKDILFIDCDNDKILEPVWIFAKMVKGEAISLRTQRYYQLIIENDIIYRGRKRRL